MPDKTIGTIVIVLICILLLPIGFGIIGGIFGIIMGIFGAVFGAIAGIIGGIFGAVMGFFGWIFGGIFGDFDFPFFHPGLFTICAVILVVVILSKQKRSRR